MNLDCDGLLSMQNKPVDVQGMYYSDQRILLVGEGDFSFSLSLATQLDIANNIVATSLDSREDLQNKYRMNAINNINNLNQRGAQVVHGVNVCNMATKNGSLPRFGSEKSFYDVINFNFPHAGFFGFEWETEVIRRHETLMQCFFKNAAFMLSPGGLVYVSHKCGFPYDNWKLEELANMNGLELIGSTPFRLSNFPGYKNLRGDGKYAGETFELAKAATYIFTISRRAWIGNMQTHNEDNVRLQTFSSLRSFKEKTIKNGRASSKTPSLQLIAAEVARLEALKLGKKKQRQLNSLKLMLKVMPLGVETPAFAIHRITSLQASSSYTRTKRHWRGLQRLALEILRPNAVEEAQNIKLEKQGVGAPKEGEGRTLLRELCVEQNMCDSTKGGCPYEQQCELQVQEVLEIRVSDDITDEILLESDDEDNEDSFCAFVLETRVPGSTDHEVMAPENTVLTARMNIGASNHMSTIGQDDMHFQLDHQSSDDDQNAMPDHEAFGVCEPLSGAMDANVDDEDARLESSCSVAKRYGNWISTYIFSCFGTSSAGNCLVQPAVAKRST